MRNIFNEIKHISKRYSHPVYRKIKGAMHPYIIWKFGEKNSDKIIYFITDVSSEISGIYSLYLHILAHMSFAYAMGWIPVVDDSPQLLRRSKNKSYKGRNVINEYFELNNAVQPTEVLQSRYVVISGDYDSKLLLRISGKEKEYYKVRQGTLLDYRSSDLSYWKKFASNNLLYKKQVQDELDRTCLKIFGGKSDILGVAIREGKIKFTSSKMKKMGEYPQKSVEEMLKLTYKYKELWGCKYIYISCETDEILKMYKNNFPNEILYLERKRVRIDDLDMIQRSSYNKMIKLGNALRIVDENRDLMYIKDMYLLSKCQSVIMPINCGTEAMYLKGAGNKNCYIVR